MFTGIVEGLGRIVEAKAQKDEGLSLLIEACGLPEHETVTLGESIAINGVCLTVAEITEPGVFQFFISRETRTRSNLGGLQAGAIVNLERALRFNGRLSGHLVQGHVDGLGTLIEIKPMQPGGAEIVVRLPKSLERYVVEKGSIALDGVSLTVNSINKSDICITLIPHTWQHTAFSAKQVGQDLNVEADVIAKYVEKLTNAHNS